MIAPVSSQCTHSSATSLGRYPEYAGSISAEGVVVVSQHGSMLVLTYQVAGLEADVSGGMHVHAGTSCETTADPGGHYYSVAEDPWDTMYTSDGSGTASGSFHVDAGHSAVQVDGHVIVLHNSEGVKVACGVLGAVPSTDLGTYADYSGEVDATGFVVVVQEDGACTSDSATLTLYYMLHGLEGGSIGLEGGLHIHEGTDCSTSGGHYYDSVSYPDDPWSTTYSTTDTSGAAYGSFVVISGYDLNESADRTIVVHASNGDRVSCGVLEASNMIAYYYLIQCTHSSATSLGRYPEYAGSISAEGVVVVSQHGSMLVLTYQVAGLEADVSGGMHVHAGTSCATTADPGGHYYSVAEDPWDTMYTSDGSGTASGSFHVDAGYSAVQVDGHVIVLHNSAGTRVACGVLGAVDTPGCRLFEGGCNDDLHASCTEGEATNSRICTCDPFFHVSGTAFRFESATLTDSE